MTDSVLDGCTETAAQKNLIPNELYVVRGYTDCEEEAASDRTDHGCGEEEGPYVAGSLRGALQPMAR